jgi:hypothetical protein
MLSSSYINLWSTSIAPHYKAATVVATITGDLEFSGMTFDRTEAGQTNNSLFMNDRAANIMKNTTIPEAMSL